jgi:hypothetical protein
MSAIELVVMATLGCLAASSLVVAWLTRQHEERDRLALWDRSLRELGFDPGELRGTSATATSGGVQLELSRLDDSEGGGTRVRIRNPRFPAGLELGREARWRRSPREVEIGDDAFDREVSVKGPPAVALAILDASLRRAVRSLVRGRLVTTGHGVLWASGELVDGTLRIDVPESAPGLRGPLKQGELPPAGTVFLDGQHKLPAVLRAALSLADQLGTPEDVAERLGQRLVGEPEARGRLRILLTLMREFGEHPATRQAILRSRDDEDAELRVRSAIALGAEGRPTLLGVAGGEGAEDATSARAVAALADSLSFGEADDLLRRARRTRRARTANECVRVLGGLGSGAVATLAKVLAAESARATAPCPGWRSKQPGPSRGLAGRQPRRHSCPPCAALPSPFRWLQPKRSVGSGRPR